MKLVALRFRFGAGALAAAAVVIAGAVSAGSASAASPNVHINCAESSLCAEVADYASVFGANYYVGHDEPTATFYSNRPGSGNRMRYVFTLPTDPSASNPSSKSYSFQLDGAIWFGMALCDTQSYPEQVHYCPPDSDRNIVDPAVSPKHPGTAFTELQFYPPGWVEWPAFQVAVGAGSCDPTKWCAAMNVFSLLEDPVNGTTQNQACTARLGSIETFEFAFVTRNGQAQAPANPLDATLQTYTPDPTKDLFMNSGDRIQVTMHDTGQGVRAELVDLNTGERGSMTASPANGFAQFEYDPTGTSCVAIPYAFHPMYSTSSEKTRVIWAAHSNSIGFTDEIGHWQSCNGAAVPATQFGVDAAGNPISCPSGNTEDDGEPAEDPATGGDDNYCFPASQSSLVQLQGCTDTNVGFDGTSYHAVWGDGNPLHPTPIKFTSPLTGPGYRDQYERAALEADLPRIETSPPNSCDRSTGAGCRLIPLDDEGQPAQFYPYFSIANSSDRRWDSWRGGGGCVWQFGASPPGTINDFGKNAGYGSLLSNPYLIFGGGGAAHNVINDFRNVFSGNPCPAQSEEHR
ncbi:MAG: hypothetical protein JO304_26285 [Solirubrobacterales bacterium]|nr:hypothetical protein [Solirubrobacterales bacterium]